MKDLTPAQIVKELDKYIIGQQEAKKSVAIALRNRYRRRLLPDVMKEEITPRNIIMMGPTGVGKTEIARRLAKLLEAPFIKVEATKFTEVGYVGRDVESMIRDLVNTSIRLVKQREIDKVAKKTENIVNDRLLDAIVPVRRKESSSKSPYDMIFGAQQHTPPQPQAEAQLNGPTEDELRSKRALYKQELLEGKLEDLVIDIMVEDTDSVPIGVMGSGGGEEITMNMSNMLGSIFPKKKKKRKTTVAAARKIFTAEESQRLIDMDAIIEEGLRLAEQDGIVFLDEIDKIAGNGYKGSGPDISREGVQRDILPIVEGCTVTTKYGPVKTDFILFIGAGAFHMSKVSDLIPELQGRFPIKVKLQALSEEDFLKILTQPENAIIKQYKELLKTEGVDIVFENEALKSLAKIAFMENETSENIGARRLYTVMEKLLEDISFYASEYDRESFAITEDYVKTVFRDEEEDYKKDTSKYII